MVLWIWDKSAKSEYFKGDAIQIMHPFSGLKTLVTKGELRP